MNERLNLQDMAARMAPAVGKDAESIEAFLRAWIAITSQALYDDRLVKIKGIGTFKVVSVEQRESVHVSTGERFVIPEHDKLTFVADREMRETVNLPFAAFETTEINEGVMFPDIENEKEEDADEETDETEPAAETTESADTEMIENNKEPEPLPETPSEPVVQQPEAEIPQEAAPIETPPEEPVVEKVMVEQPLPQKAPEEKVADNKKEKDIPVRELESNLDRILDSQSRKYDRLKSLVRVMIVLLIIMAAANIAICFMLYKQNRGMRNMITDFWKRPTEMAVPADTVATGAVPQRDSLPAIDTTSVPPEISQPEIIGEETIRTGVSLARIAKKYYGNSVFWVYLYQYNKERIADPNNVPVGTVIRVPSKEKYHIDIHNRESVRAASALQTQILTNR